MIHPMNSYIRDRMVIDAQRVISLAAHQASLEHPGLKGRFRELLVDGILEPWLPPTVSCATGTVISWTNTFRSKTQEDILLIDRSISPAVLLKHSAQEGVFLRNSVLARIEVKSTLTAAHVTEFNQSCLEYHGLNLDLNAEQAEAGKMPKISEINILFGFKSSASAATLLSWFNHTLDGTISVVCVPEYGLWKISKPPSGSVLEWLEYTCQTQTQEAERLAAFVALVSNIAFAQHLAYQGRDPLSSLEGGVGQYFNDWISISN